MRKVKHRERFSGSPKSTEHSDRARTHIQVVQLESTLRPFVNIY